MPEKGYAGSILKIDLNTHKISRLDTADYANRFLGGRGIGAKIYWDFISPTIKAFDPENYLVIITGPVAGFTGFAGCRWQICGKSPQVSPDSFSYANLGGSWGAWLKYAGYDGLIISGKSERPVYLCIGNDDHVEFHDASHLWGQTNLDTHDILHAELGDGAKIFGIGPAGENQVYFSLAMSSDHSLGGGGLVAVMGSKNLKAIVVKTGKITRPVAAEPEKLKFLARRVLKTKEANWEQFPLFEALGNYTPCYGCIGGKCICNRATYKAECGRIFRYFCQSTMVYTAQALKYSDKESTEAYRLATRLCDNYGLDSMVMRPLIDWLGLCYQSGLINERETELPLSKLGSIEFITALVRKISYREGFGNILAQGTIQAAEHIGKGSHKLFGQCGVLTKDSETNDYDPRLLYAHSLINATEPRKAIHLLHATALPFRRWVDWLNKKDSAFLSTEILQRIAREYWGSTAAADMTTYEGKSLAAKKVQDYGYVKESLILCDLMWPIHQVRSVDNTITCGTLESQIVSAITGREIDEAGLLPIGERVFNLQRMALLRDGWQGRKTDTILDYFFEEPLQEVFWNADCLIPDINGQIVSRKGAVVDRAAFEKMKSEYYAHRGWDTTTGVPTVDKLNQLNLADLIPLSVDIQKSLSQANNII